MNKNLLLPILVAVSTITGSSAVFAQSAEQKALARAQYMLRQANAEKAGMQQEITSLKEQLASLEQQLEDSKISAKKKQGKLSNALDSWKEGYEKLQAQYQDTRKELYETDQNLQRMSVAFQTQTENFELCFDNNNKLYEINKEMLSLYQNKGAVDSFLQKEPFTGLKQVEIENLVQDYQYKMDDLSLGENSYLIQKTSAVITP